MRARLILALSLLPSGALAQDTQQAAAAVHDPSQTGAMTSGRSQLTLTSSQDDTNVRAEIGLPFGNWTTALRVQAPVRKGAERHDLATLSDLTNGTVGSLHVTYLGFGRSYDPDAIRTVCDTYNRTVATPPPTPIEIPQGNCTMHTLDELFARWKTPGAEIMRQEYIAAKRRALHTTCDAYNKTGQYAPILPLATACTDYQTILAAMKAADAAHPECATAEPAAECWQTKLSTALKKELTAVCERLNSDPSAWGQFVPSGERACRFLNLAAQGPDWRERALSATHFSPWYVGAQASVKTDTFKYAPAPQRADTKATRHSTSFGVELGKLVVSTNTFLGLTASLEHSYKGDDSVQLCQPLEGGPSLTCRNVALNAPTDETAQLLVAELRQFLGSHVAINPRIARDFHEKVNAGEILLYMFEDPTKGLNGGIDITWKDNSNTAITLFIGRTFELFSH